jgi:signal transduction histidine kinase
MSSDPSAPGSPSPREAELLALIDEAVHDLRNPLNAIAGWAHLLGELDPESPRYRAAIEAIAANVKLQTRQIEELADVAALAGPGLRVTLSPLDLAPLLDTALRSVNDLAERSNVTIRPPRTARLQSVAVLADARRIAQVVTDLLRHAVAATPEGGAVEVDVGTAGDRIRIEVSAPRAQLPGETFERLFELFAPRPAGTRRGGPRLAIARRVAELHGGSLEARRGADGSGLSFVLALPLEDSGG